MLIVGATKVGSRIVKQTVTEIGKEMTFGTGYLLPVKFSDGSYGIIYWSGDKYSVPPRPWIPDNTTAARAISHALEMPSVAEGIGSGVIHVRGVDQKGNFLVKLFYNDKKIRDGREDELYR